MILKKTIGIDLGTDTTQIYLGGAGIIVNEPSIVAYNNLTNRIVAVGAEAKKMLSRTPAHITVLRPVGNGVIADFDMVKEMIQSFLKRENIPWSWMTRVVVSVPTNLTEVERKSVEDLFREVGATPVFLIEQPLAAALGSRLDIHQPTAHFIVNIGAGTTDIAMISLSGIVVSRRLKIAGDYLNNEIVRGVREELKLNIGEPTAEEIKLAVGSVVPMNEKLELVIRGRDVQNGLPREALIKDTQVRFWLARPAKLIVEAIKDVIENAPPELVGDVYRNGIYLCGGGSMLRGVDQLASKEIGVPVAVIEDPLTCVARGTGVLCDKFQEYQHLLNIFSHASEER
ncbi:MAG: rod shape-determining protein [Candidatus Jorgensenbacteria bacterium]|nr:rod shape-determining protein [Candidatus Jorgensenbacteria bacterium]